VGVEEGVNMRFKAPRFFKLAYLQPNKILSSSNSPNRMKLFKKWKVMAGNRNPLLELYM
jgi:hypothetical protein